MKKIFLILSVTIISLTMGAWWNKTPSRSPALDVSRSNKQSPERILENDFEKITKNLNPKNIQSDEWVRINDYSLTPSSLVSSGNAKIYFMTAKNNLPDLYICLKKDFCGMETRGEDDAYFDDERTPAHILINRNLKIMKESLKKDSKLIKEVDWNLLEELASSNSEMLSVEAIEIMREFGYKTLKTAELIDLTREVKGTAKADSLVSIAKRATSADKILLSNEVKEIFSKADANTVISVLEKLKSMEFYPSQIPNILQYLCQFKADHNWPIIKTEAGRLYSQFENNCN